MNIDISKVKGIIFDYGGTLDTGGDHWSEIIWQSYRASDVAISKPGSRGANAVEEKSAATARYCYNAARASVEAAIPVLEALSERYPIVLVSNFYGNIETVLEDFGVRRFFDAIIESAVLGIRKPDPRIFEHGVKALGLLPEQTLVIGDSYHKDIVPAESLGCQAIWLKGKGWTEEEDAQLHPNTIHKLNEVLGILL